MLDIVASYHCIQFQEKLMNEIWENDKKPSFVPHLVSLAQIWVPNFFFLDFTSTRC